MTCPRSAGWKSWDFNLGPLCLLGRTGVTGDPTHSQWSPEVLGLRGGEGVLRKVSLLICKMGTTYYPQAHGVDKGQVSESIPVGGLGQNLVHTTCSISVHGLPSTHLWSGPRAWVSRVRKGRPGLTVVDKTPALGEPQSVGDTVIGRPLHPHGGHSPVLEDAASPRGEVQPLPGVCPVSGEPRSRPGTLTLCSPQHCLLGWDILPPKSEKSSAPKSLDLWSSVSSEAQRRKLSATSPSHRVRSREPWERQMPWSGLGTAASWGAGLG